MKSLRIVAVVAVCATAVFWGSSSAQAGDNGPSISLTINPTTGPLGSEINASGQCLQDNQTFCFAVVVSLIDPEGTTVDSDSNVDEGGAYEFTLTVPVDGLCGQYTVFAEGGDSEGPQVDTSETFTVPCSDTTIVPTSEAPTSSSVQDVVATRPSFTG